METGSIFPEYYAVVKEYELSGNSPKQAEKEEIASITENEALYRYALDKGYRVSDKELKERMQKELKDMESTEEYADIQAAYKKEGLSFKDEFWDDRKSTGRDIR